MYPDMAFLGSQLGDKEAREAPLKVAVQGSQRIRVLSSPTDTIGVPAFQAASSGTAVSITNPAPPDVSVLGLQEGTAYLRILDPVNAQLYGRAFIEVIPLDTVNVRPKSYQSAKADMDFMNDANAQWSLYTGRMENVVVRLFDAGNNRLADERMNIGVSGSELTTSGAPNWDTLTIRAAAGISGTGTLTVRPGDNSNRDQSIQIVNDIDQIIWVRAENAAQDPSVPIPTGTSRTFCFRAMKGGKLVAGVTWVPAVSPTIVLAGFSQAPNCVSLQSNTVGSGVLTITAEATAQTYPLTFTQ